MITEKDFTRIKNDVNGNPRYVIHFCALSAVYNNSYGSFNHNLSVSEKYQIALKEARKLGGKKFHNKQYGGGIVFQSYNLQGLCADLNALTQNIKNA